EHPHDGVRARIDEARDATRGGVNGPALPVQRGRESPLPIDAPFWMVGEFWGHGPARGPLHDAGFDAMINFEFQDKVKGAIGKPGARDALDALFASYAA